MLFFKPTSYLGVDLGAGGVKIVELKREKNRPVLFTYGLTRGSYNVHRLLEKKELTANDLRPQTNSQESRSTLKPEPTFLIDKERVSEFANIIKAVCKEARTTATRAVASLPVSSVFHSIVTLPMVKKEEFDRILRAEVKKLLPYPIEEMALEYEVMRGVADAKDQRVLVNAVPRALVVFYTEVFKVAGIKLDSLEPESIALARALVGRDQAPTMIIDMGAERTNFFIVEQGVPVTHHSVELGGDKVNQHLAKALGLEVAVTEQIKQDLFTHLLASGADNFFKSQNFLALFNNVVDPIMKEIAYSLELYERQSMNTGKHPEKIILTGGAAYFPFLTDLMSEKFKLKCYLGDPWGRIVYQDGLKPILRNLAPRLAVAIGLALRNVV
jgi:type IV pilus assembly protein PilM